MFLQFIQSQFPIFSSLISLIWNRNDLRFSPNVWYMINDTKVPQQTKDGNCGVFVLAYAHSYALETKMTFTEEDMPYYRRKIAFEILRC
jgi:sentrin-specific protease 1